MGALLALDSLLATRTLWHAGRGTAPDAAGEPTGHGALDALLPRQGWPRGALTELLLPADGVGELSLLAPTLSRLTRAGGTVAVVAPPYVPYAPAWQAAGIDLGLLEIVDAAPRDALWAFEQCLRSGACSAVLGWPAQADGPALRRLQVAADSGDCLGFALRDRRHAANPSPAALRLEAVPDADGRVAWQVRKCRGGPVPAQAFVPEPEADARRPVAC
ncbi:translesion DNA synthesis-associated protein ImuA [Lysobacter sp. A3-1-A15]|uniref:translesion DNA synthesis-associated protein ImuA n=1 Tax=Novilysobacter viscosus TaxID=3098602 RepID=UPI002ED92262